MSSEVKPLLLRVAEACNEHEQFHKGRPYEEIIPNECQTAQLGLQKSLPRAEEEYGADANPHPLDVIHLCDFYRNILSGVFCPHAPQLFQWGNGGTKIFPRVMCLYEHLGSKRILQLTMNQEFQEIEEVVVIGKICTTIAHLLNFIPRLQSTVLRDLMNFLFDLGVISEANLLEYSDSVEVSMFCETSVEDYFLKIRSAENLVLLQMSTMKVIQILLTLQRIKETESPSYNDPRKEFSLEGPFEHVNCHLGHMFSDGALLADFLACCRQIILSEHIQSDNLWSLSLSVKISAVSIINFFVQDQKSFAALHSTLPSFLALIISQSAATFFDSLGNCPDVPYLKKKCEALACCINEAIHRSIICPQYGIYTVHEIRLQVISPLIDCLRPMSKLSLQRDALQLGRSILAAIHTSLSTPSPLTNEFFIARNSASLFSMNWSMSALLEMLKEWKLSREAIVVLNDLLVATETVSLFGQDEIVISCSAAWAKCTMEKENIEAQQESSKSDDTLAQSGKRKVAARISPKRNTRNASLAQHLIVERSPKRQRSYGIMATPSPAGDGLIPEVFVMHTDITSPTRKSLESITLSFCQAIECAKRILSSERPIFMEDTASDVVTTTDVCLLVSYITILSNHVTRYLNTNQINDGSLGSFQISFPEVFCIFELLTTATQRVTEALSSRLQLVDRGETELQNQLLDVADILISCALSLHFVVAKSPAKRWTDTYLFFISHTAWQIWMHYNNRTVSIPEFMKARANICCDSCAPVNTFPVPQHCPSLCVLQLLYRTTLLERMGLLACLKPFQLYNTSSNDIYNKCRECLTQVFIDFRELDDSTQASILQLTPILVVSLSNILKGHSGESKAETLDGNLSPELLSIIPLQYMMEIASNGNSKYSAARFAVETLHHLQKVFVTDLSFTINIAFVSRLLHTVRTKITRIKVGDGTHAHTAINHGMCRGMNMEILRMAIPTLETFDATKRLVTWSLLSQACQSTNVIDFHLPKTDRNAAYTDATTKPFLEKSTALVWLFEAPFVDPDPKVRRQIAPFLGKTLLRDGASLLGTLFANGNERDLLVRDENSRTKESTAATVISRTFHAIDTLMFKFCQVPQSQLSFTMACTSVNEATNLSSSESSRINEQRETTVVFQYAAIQVLTSFCKNVDPSSYFGRLVFEYSFVRLLRFWTSTDNNIRTGNASHDSKASISALAFHAIMGISKERIPGQLLEQQGKEIYAPVLFVDLLFPCTTSLVTESSDCDPMAREVRKDQYNMLFTFIASFLVKQPSLYRQLKEPMLDHESSIFEVSAFFGDAIRFIFPSLMLENDYDTLRLATGFNLFLLHQRKQIEKQVEQYHVGPSDKLIGSPLGPIIKIRGVDASRSILEEQTKLLCLHPINIGMILPRLLASNIADRRSSPLLFFLETVIKRTVQLKEMIQFESSKLLGNILWELSLDDEMEHDAVLAIRSAAAALDKDCLSGGPVCGGNEFLNELASRWVSVNFLSLTVNIVQQKWKFRSMQDRVRGLRCLKIMLLFLLPGEAPQFVPQMLATVNMAMSDDSKNEPTTSLLRLFAVQVLSQYLRLWAEDQSETLGQHLTTVVVSLFPVIPQSNSNSTNAPEWEAGKVAISLLEWLSSGALGEKLAVFFKDIPFLPQFTSLDKVRNSLQSFGVDFNNLFEMTSAQEAQDHDVGGSTDGEQKDAAIFDSVYAQKSLQRRIGVLCPLFEHESSSVRKVALQYLTNLLRANRFLFYKLIEIEEQSPAALFLTVTYDDECPGKSRRRFTKGRVAWMMETLLRRCGTEDDDEAQLYLAVCLGEIGAIDGNRLGEICVGENRRQDRSGIGDLSRSWLLTQPPWKSRSTRYELQLVTKHLVGALKAAPDSTDLDKIAFTIQQLLGNLDKDGKRGNDSIGTTMLVDNIGDLQKTATTNERGEMSQWLRDQLSKAEVLEMIEPFWASKYKEASSKTMTEYCSPPFFKHASSYFVWLSNFCRYMIRRSKISGDNQWTDFFFACRTAIRSSAGLAVAEFILPLLILDRLCSDIKVVEDAIHSELLDVLCHHLPDIDTDSSTSCRMGQGERQKAISAVFSILDTLQWWAEHEIEDRHKCNSRLSSSSRSTSVIFEDSSNWSAVEGLNKIEALMDAVPLELRAKAATSVGMHARALQCLEMLARGKFAREIFDSPTQNRPEADMLARPRKGHVIDGLNSSFLKKVLGNLDDFDTMSGVPKPELEVFGEDSIVEREARGDFEGAYNDYERCLQLEENPIKRRKLEEGALRCLLELGRFETVLNQVNGMISRPEIVETILVGEVHSSKTNLKPLHLIPFAVEAAWKLGRWSEIDGLLAAEMGPTDTIDEATAYHISLGKVMLGLQERSQSLVDSSLECGRRATLSALSNMSRESYTRSYPFLVRLHCLREIQDVSEVFLSPGQCLSELANSPIDFDWNGRLAVVSSLKSFTVIDVRTALARLANDASLEGSLHLKRGVKARKNGMYKIAANSFAKAASTIFQTDRGNDSFSRIELADFMGSIQMQLAKLEYNTGEIMTALRILGDDDVRGWLDVKAGNTHQFAVERDAITMSKLLKTNGLEVANSDRFAKRLLQSTQWMVEGGLKGVSELTERFKVAHELAPTWEKCHFQFAKYIDTILETRITALGKRDMDMLNSVDEGAARSFTVFRDENCQNYLVLAMKQYIEALKLGEKHVYIALPRLLSLWFEFTGILGNDIEKLLDTKKDKEGLNDNKAQKCLDFKAIMISKQSEVNVMMSEATRTIPAKSLYTAMPQLISRVNHRNSETALVIHGILSRVLMKFPGQAVWTLTWLRNSANKDRARIGDFIFKNAQDGLVKRKQKKCQRMLLSSAKLVKFLIDLAKYKPSEPTASQFTIRPWTGEVDLIDFVPPVQAALSTAQDQDRISDMFPRMRAINPQVAVMSSKARPKRLRIFMVPGGRKPHRNPESGKQQPDDIGELHFLVKNEEKGDLRKDARVQDLNNVINRLLANSSKDSQNHRRLSLRTFAVTCLSEDCGILEWVPNTESFRGLVLKTYNPQAMPTSHRRRGKRLGNFGDVSLRQTFDKCQAMYFKNGNLTKAAAMFDDLCLRNYPPLFYWWFVQNFTDPHSWYDARTRFTHSSAVWSAVGHVIGLGDRHSENILIDTSSGACVHVDFDCIFDKGLTLPKPEVIPFRLTSNMLDAFGPVGADGIFASSLKMAMTTLRGNRDTLLSVLEPFLKDPIIDWKKQRSQQKQEKAGASVKESQDAKQSMQIIEERLRGVYNLRNPNHKKITRTDRVSNNEDDDMMYLLPLSVEGQVNRMISEATSSENLLQCYIGWMPWI